MNSLSLRAIWVALALIVGALVGVGAATVTFISGAGWSRSTLIGGAAFAGGAAFVLTLLQFLQS
ncbi:hypothetical protein ABT256_12550 [Amycolatopsis japonica]|uniref:hypothetical protein n=1 Tax=Amycolatopsis japonica TaxID=208439 RepID=UPI00331D883D